MSGKTLPLTNTCGHICFFRQALALDERRVKFQPECIAKGTEDENIILDNDRAKEVWFPGSHSDVQVFLLVTTLSLNINHTNSGGGNRDNKELNLEAAPLLWMEHEAFRAGLLLHISSHSAPDYYNHTRYTFPHKSLKGLWWLLEVLPIRRYRHTDPRKATR